MKKTQIVLSVLASLALSAGAANVSTWTNAVNGVVDWSANGWSPSAPGVTDTAYFPSSANACYFIVTPPADFAGTILTTNETAYTSDGTSNWTQPTYVQLTARPDAAWIVDGCGVAIVSNGFTAARVASTFRGVISIPEGLSFVAESTLDDAIEYIGAGTLTITKPSQFAHIGGFSGRLIRTGEALTATVPEIAAYEGRTLVPENGDTLALGEDLLTIGATEPMAALGGSGWSVQTGRTSEDFDHYYGAFAGGTPAPSAVSDDEFCLVDAPNQYTSTFYTNRLVRLCDDWGASFDLISTCPSTSQIYREGWHGQGHFTCFAIVMQNRSPDNLKEQAGCTSASNAYGVAVYTYINNENCRTYWRWNSNLHSNSQFPPALQGIYLISDKAPQDAEPIHVTVSCVAGRLTYTFSKNGRSMTASRDFLRYLETQGRGVYIGFTASAGGDGVDKFCSWGITSIRHFRGWIRTREALPRVRNETLSVLSAENYTNANIVVEGSAVVTNANAFGESGALITRKADYSSKILRYTRGSLAARYTLNPKGRYLLTCDVAYGNKTSSLYGGAYFGVVGGRDTQYMMSGTTRYGIGRIGIGDMEGWCYGLYMPHYIGPSGTPYGRLWLNYYDGGSKKDNSHYTTTRISSDSMAKSVLGGAAASRARYRLLYDGVGKRAAMDYTRIANTGLGNGGAWSATFRSSTFDKFLACAGKELHPGYYLGTNNSCIDATVTGLAVEEISDNANPYLNSVLAVESGRTVTLALAASHPASSTPAATLRRLELAEGATLSVTATTSAARLALDEVSLSGAATLAVGSGATVRMGDALALSAASDSLSVSGSVEFATEGLTVTIPQAVANARKHLVPLDLGKATISGALPSEISVVTDLGSNVTARARATFENAKLQLYMPRGAILILR